MHRGFRIGLALATLCTAAGIAWAAHQTGDGIAYDRGDPLPVKSSASFQYSFAQDVVTSAPVRLVNARLQLASVGTVPRVVERRRVRRARVRRPPRRPRPDWDQPAWVDYPGL